ncbi:MAG: hypothetical protein ABL993_16570, partial [Vicinamibacterales bacterium]
AATWLSTPIIYSMIVPFAFLDAWATLYQWLSFPIYGVPVVARRRFFTLDRFRLAYLSPVEKVNCLYCNYANGVLGYVGEITARTEEYWCPIKQSRRPLAEHSRYQLFAEYGDAAGYRRVSPRLRRLLRAEARARAATPFVKRLSRRARVAVRSVRVRRARIRPLGARGAG